MPSLIIGSMGQCPKGQYPSFQLAASTNPVPLRQCPSRRQSRRWVQALVPVAPAEFEWADIAGSSTPFHAVNRGRRLGTLTVSSTYLLPLPRAVIHRWWLLLRYRFYASH